MAAGVYDLSAGGVGAEAEQFEQALLGGVAVGEHAAGSGAAACRWVEQHGFADSGQGAQELSDGEVQAVKGATSRSGCSGG